MIDIRAVLEESIAQGASDIQLKVDSPPTVRIAGLLKRLDMPALTREDTFRMAFELMSEEHRSMFQRKSEVDFSFSLGELSRFRMNIFR